MDFAFSKLVSQLLNDIIKKLSKIIPVNFIFGGLKMNNDNLR